MTDYYDSGEKADSFDLFKKNTFVSLIEQPSIRKMLNYNLEGKRVIDLACGGGDSTKMLADMNPSELVGVDLSSSMIEKAIKSCANDAKYSKIKFFAQNCLEPIRNEGQFDLVFAIHLLNYAFVKEDLLTFYRNMYEICREGGMCCGMINSPFISREELNVPGRLLKYGIEYFRHEDNVNQDVHFYWGDKLLFSVKGCVWPSEWHEECAKKAGFKSFEWIEPALDENYQDKDGFFDSYLKHNPTVFYKIFK